jgi:hypothetical protein
VGKDTSLDWCAQAGGEEKEGVWSFILYLEHCPRYLVLLEGSRGARPLRCFYFSHN